MNDTITFPYSEKLAAEQFGIARGELREARNLHLQPDVDWKKTMAALCCFLSAG
jgi:hypothetical protein